MSTRTQEAIQAHQEMQWAWASYAAEPRVVGRYRAYVEAHDHFVAEAVAAHMRLIPTEDEGLARAIADMAYPLHWIGDRYGWDAELQEG